MSMRKSFPLLKIVNSSIIDLPSPINLSVNWNFGSILSLILVNQIATGLILASRFSCHTNLAFESVILLTQDSQYGWLLRLLHSTGASFFFLFLYLHIGRGIYYGSFNKILLWNSGVTIYFILIITAFMGYVLPWGQMSYWAATVITNLLSAVPLIGKSLVTWVWGGFAVGNPTLTRFYMLHFLLPFVVLGLVLLHLFYLHLYTSSNPMGISSVGSKVSFHYFYSTKDFFFFLLFIFILVFSSCVWGYDFMDPENFIPANMLVTPTHIQPEWYFLFAYAILRAIPNKLGGIIAMIISILILFIYSVNGKNMYYSNNNFSILGRLLFWSLVTTFFCLTWLGACPPEYPYLLISQIMTATYFGCHILLMSVNYTNNQHLF